MVTFVQLKNVGEVKRALKGKKSLYVWVNWQQEDGGYIRVSKKDFLVGIGADSPNDGAHGGVPDGTACYGRLEDDEVYIN